MGKNTHTVNDVKAAINRRDKRRTAKQMAKEAKKKQRGV